jgi:uncharacterized protein YndB with AHSA1/START domain
MTGSTDRIEKKVRLHAPLERVWHAISDARQFGSWFGVEFDGPFVAHSPIVATLVPTTVDSEVAKTPQPYRGYRFEFQVDRIEPMRLFSFRWHPFAVDAGVDYSKEPSTLVEFKLEEISGGVMLTVIESGFDQIPLERRAKAFAANESGWTTQATLIEKYLALAA